MTEEELLARLGRAYGIGDRYHDIWGRERLTSSETLRALLAAMGLRVANPAELAVELEARESRVWTRTLEPVRVVRPPHDAITVPFNIEVGLLDAVFELRLECESGRVHVQQLRPRESAGQARELGGRTWVRCRPTLDLDPGIGYHRLELRGARLTEPRTMRLIVAPSRCHRPASIEAGRRTWGPAVQLYALRSARNWGIGDLGDLAQLAAAIADRGGGIVGLNPLHVSFPRDPEQASPYSPSSRLFQNPLYLELEAIPEFATSPEVRSRVGDPAFAARLAGLRALELVDYRAVAGIKREILELCYAHFRREHLAPRTARSRAFRAYVESAGEPLAAYGRFEALAERFPGRWPDWPAELRRPDTPEVARVAREAVERVEFHQWVQWQIETQWAAVAMEGCRRGLWMGLYRDLAVGADRSGFDGWRWPELHAAASWGAPPDDFAPQGQEWGLPPWIPERLREARYQPFVELLRANMRDAGALRIDHVMGLMRGFWVPEGGKPADGAYVHYPFDDLLGILALESQRQRCLVIGEDLGTVPDEVRGPLATAGVLSYRPLLFMKDEQGSFSRPADYPAQALVTVATHDLPTLAGFWSGRDIELRHDLGLAAEGASRQAEHDRRADERRRLLEALEREGLLPAGVAIDGATPLSLSLVLAIHRYLARTPAQVLSFQLEDVLGRIDQANLPGTTGEHPNWRRKLGLEHERLVEDRRFNDLCAVLREERGPRN